jgi:hypothetical protein
MKKIIGWFNHLGSEYLRDVNKTLLWVLSRFFIILVVSFFTVLPFLLIMQFFLNPKNDTTTITNIGFALLAGLASISFSYSKTIEPTEVKTIKSVVYAGKQAFLSSLMFLMASAFKYAHLYFEGEKTASAFSNIIRAIPFWVSSILFLMALNFLTFSVLRIAMVLRQRLQNEPPLD